VAVALATLSFLAQYCHYHSLTDTIRTARTSSFQRCHCHPATATRCSTVVSYSLPCHILTNFYYFLSFLFNPSPLGQYCHCHTLTTTIRTALISSFQRCHCHPATATPHPGSRCSTSPTRLAATRNCRRPGSSTPVGAVFLYIFIM
jgi:hypothetical protein